MHPPRPDFGQGGEGLVARPITCYDDFKIPVPGLGTYTPFAVCKVTDTDGIKYKITGPQTTKELIEKEATCAEHEASPPTYEVKDKKNGKAKIGDTVYCL